MDRSEYYKITTDYYERVGNLWGLYTGDEYSIESFKYGEDNIGEIVKKSGISDNMTVLDCGCGFGKMIKKLQQKFPSSTFLGVTLNECHVKRKQHKGITIGNFDNLQIEDNSVDVVTFIESFNHSYNKRKTLKEAYRVLKKGGTLFIVDMCISNDLFKRLIKDKRLRNSYKLHRKFYGSTLVSSEFINRIAKKVGFTLIHCEEVLDNKIIINKNQVAILKPHIIAEYIKIIYSDFIFNK
jgi:ubiquinone/menaquinone biosynthesis C-methylase UbiE